MSLSVLLCRRAVELDSLPNDANGFYDKPDLKKPPAEVSLSSLSWDPVSFVVRREAACKSLRIDGCASLWVLRSHSCFASSKRYPL